MLQDILIPFLAIGLAELGDKTQLAIFCLASKTKKYMQLLFGVILAFIVADGLAVLLGDFIKKYISLEYIQILSGILFLAVGFWILFSDSKEEKCEIKKPFISGFSLILISEMGDKTQLAAALFATNYNPLFVFIGVISSLAVLSIIVVFMGKFVMARINKKTIHYLAGILFIIIGLASFYNNIIGFF